MPRLRALNGTEMDRAVELRESGKTLREVAEEMNVSTTAVLSALQTRQLPIIKVMPADTVSSYWAGYGSCKQGPIVCEDRWHLESCREFFKNEIKVELTRSKRRWKLPVCIESNWPICLGEIAFVRGIVDRCGHLNLRITRTMPSPVLTLRIQRPQAWHDELIDWIGRAGEGIALRTLKDNTDTELVFTHRRAEKLCRLLYENSDMALPSHRTVWRYAKTLRSEKFEFLE